MLAGDDAASAVVYSCGPPAMLEAVRALCAERGVACELALESPMACGYGACFGCAVPQAGRRLHAPLRRRPGLPRWRVESLAARRSAEHRGIAVTDPRRVEFCGIALAHPVVNASGTYDAIAARRVFGDALLEDFPFSAFVSKTITPEPRAGNAPQRIWETPAGMINSIGLPNKGLDGFLAEDLPQLAELPVPLIVSVMATSREEFSRLVEGVAERDEVAAIELNVSCPNVHSGLIVGEQPAETVALLEALRPLTAKPLIVKLTPNVADPAAVAVAAEEGGADAVSLINTLKASAIDPRTRRPGAGRRPRRPLRARGAPGRAAAAARGRGRGRAAGGRHGGDLPAAPTRANSSPPERRLVAVGTENFRDPTGGLAGRRGARREPVATGRGRPSTRPRVEVEVNLGANWAGSACTPLDPRLYSPPHMPAPQSKSPPPPPNGPWTSGWRRSNGPTTSAPRGPN